MENALSLMPESNGAIAPRATSASPILKKIWRDYRPVIRGTYTFILALIVWEVVGRYVITSRLMFAPISVVAEEFVKLWASGGLQQDILVSFTALVLGFTLAAAIGIAVGSIIAVSDAASEHFDPLINALYATPLIALAPILILVLGIGEASKIAIVCLLAVFPILINTKAGIRAADESLIEAARSFGASRFEIFRLVLIPSALPFIVAGFRLGIGKGLIAVFIGELFGARAGLGYLILLSSQNFDIPGMFVGVIILAGTGVLLVALFEYLERKIAPWRQFDLKA